MNSKTDRLPNRRGHADLAVFLDGHLPQGQRRLLPA
jgi:hypothetical protein